MAIAYDAYYEGSVGPGSSITYAHTTTGSDLGLVAFVGDMGGARLTGITYNSVAMTQAERLTFETTRNIWIYKLSAPASGSNNVVASFSASDYYSCQTISYTGVHQTDFEDTSTTQTGTTSLTLSVTTTADNCWLASASTNVNVGPMTASTGTTLRGNELSCSSGDSNGAKTPSGGPYTMVWTAASGASGGAMIAIKPAGAGGGSAGTGLFLSSLGVG